MKVFLHVGAGKTGTSAIQVALAQNRAALAEAGIYYPEPPGGGEDRAARGEISSGNARALGWFCNPNLPGRDLSRDGVRQWIADSIASAGGRQLLFSSESMQSARPGETRELVSLFTEAGYATEVIFYVRHVLDHAVAEYLQHVKMGFTTLSARDRVSSLETFLPIYRCRYLNSIRAFAESVPHGSIHVRLYDDERARLVPNFFGLLGVPAPQPPGNGAERIINRSPAPDEVPLFEHLARLEDGARLCRLLTDMLLNTAAPSNRPFSVPESVFGPFRERNQDAVDQLNATWLSGASRLLMKSDRIRLEDQPTPTTEQMKANLGDILAVVLRAMDATRGRPRVAGQQRSR